MGKTLGYGEITVANMTEPFTVMLTNEAQQFATDSNRKVTSTQSYYTDIIVIRGSQERTDYTIGNITSGSGITVSKNSKRVTFSVSAGTTIGADAGVIEIPITLDGQTVKKQFSWSCGKQGPQGVKGEDGSNFAWNLLKGTGTAKEFTPKGNLTNQTTLFNKLDLSGQTLKEGDKFVISCDLEWTQFTQGTSGTFDYWFQGSVDYSWSYDNIFTQGLQKVQPTKAEILASDGKKHLSAVCTIKQSLLDKKIFEIGIRFDNTDGTGKIKISNLKIAKEDKESPWCLHPDELKGATGDKGKSVQSVIEYYLATSASTGVTTSTSGWSTDPTTQKLTAEKKYLWNCKQTVYDDGTRGSITSPVICGTYGDKGDTGQKGKDGTSIKITSKSVTYQTSTSGTTAPTGTWSTTVPIVNNGQYLWTKTTVQYSDSNKTEAYSVSYKGTNGTNGTSVTVSKTEVTYQVSASGTTAPTGTWSTTMPSCDQGQYLWTKTYVKYSDGKDTTSYSVSYKGVDGEKFAFNMLRETNQGSKHWVNMGASGKYYVESITTEDSINAVKLICTKPIASNEWQFCDFSDYEMLKSLKASTTYTLSYDIKTNRSGKILHNIKTGGGQKLFFANDIACKVLGNETWEHVSLKMTSGTTLPNLDGQVIYMFGDALSKVGYSIIKNLKLTEGIVDTPWAPHPKDLEGRGVSQTVQYYLATSQASGVTASTSGWSTDITTQKLTADKKYLWNCYQTKYSDGTSEPISTPKVIGVYGDKGQNAKNLTITPSSQYFKSTDGGKTFAPNTITIKPTIQGEISFGKWQYSIDGGVSFADVVSGQTGLTINNNVLTVSKDSSLYSDDVTMVTFRAVANDSSFYDTCSIAKIYDVNDIGDGRNLLLNTSSYRESNPLERTGSKTDDYSTYPKIITSIDLSANQKYTLQAKTDSNWATKHDTGGHAPSEKLVGLWLVSDDTNTFLDMSKGYAVFTAPKTTKYKLRVNQYSDGTNSYTIRLWDIKLEKGQSASGWSAAPEDVQTAILSTKSEISDVSSQVDKNKQAIEQRVEKTTYQQDLNLVKGDISKANEGLNKWRYEIYPKSLFASEYQGKSTMDVFAKSTNLTPSQSVLINDTDLSIAWNYAENYIGYALTFTKFSAAKSVAITFAHDDGAHIYLNGKLIGGSDAYNKNGESLTLGFVKGWNCIEVVVNEGASTEGFKLGTTISAISECQLMNCYYGTPVARQSHITNQLVENTTNIEGVTTTMQKVMTTVGGSDRIDEFVNNYNKTIESEKQFKKTIGETYTTKDEFNGLEIGGRNLVLDSKPQKQGSSYAVVSRHLSIDLQAGVTYTISFCGRVVDGDGSLVVYLYRNDWKDSIQKSTKSKENTVISWQFTPKISGAFQIEAYSFLSQGVAGGNVYLDWFKVEKGNKATDWTPAPEDDEINGQNLVSNLPSNWEQGTVTEGSAIGTTYANTKSSSAGSIRPKELIPVSGDITISIAYSNQSKKPVRHWIAAYDVNKNYLGNNYVSNAWNNFPRTLNMKDAKYIAIMVGYTDSSAITPSDISQICLKIERGTSATPFTLAPEDVNGKIVNVETIANQTAKKFEWIVKSGTSSSNFEITDKFMNLVSTNINLDGIVSFMNTAKGDGRKNLYNLDYSNFENVASQKDAICYAKDNGVTSVAIDSSVSYDGNKSLKISYTTANLNSSTTPLYLGSSANNYGCVKIQAGKQYILSCYVKSDSTTGLFMIDIQGHDTPDTKTDGLYLSNIDPRKLPGSSTGVNLSTDWQRAVCAIKVADNATGLYWSVVPLIWGKPSSSSAPQTFNVWVDCIMLEEVDSISNEPGTYIFDKETIIDGGSIKTDTITGNQILAGSITADKIATDAIKSRNYISSGGTQGSFLNLSDGSFTSPNLSWDSNGNLIAKNANLSGEITATKGTIGKYEITDQWLTTGSGSTCTGIGGNQAFWAGAEDSNSAPFRVEYDGKLTSSNADITGTITATNGKIGRYDITSTYLMTNSGSNASGIGGNQAFWAGAEDSNSAPFRVGYDGVLWAENAAIRGSIETGNLGDEGDTVVIMNGRIGIQGTSNNVEIYSTGFKFGIDGDYYLESVSEGVKCYRNLYATDFIADGWIYNASGGHYTWKDRDDAYISCGDYNGHNVYYYANYHAFYVNKDSGQGMMYINTNGVTSRVGFTKTSDERIKKNFESFDDNIIDAYMNIEPVKYQLKQSSNDNYHFGFKAQHVDKVFSDYGDIYNESFDICTSRPIDPDKAKELYGVDDMTEEYGLRYDELIAPTTYMVQHIYKELESTKGELAKVKQEKADLETRLQAIEAKLGL